MSCRASSDRVFSCDRLTGRGDVGYTSAEVTELMDLTVDEVGEGTSGVRGSSFKFEWLRERLEAD